MVRGCLGLQVNPRGFRGLRVFRVRDGSTVLWVFRDLGGVLIRV